MLKKSEFRKDYFLDRFVLITPGRAKRPEELHENESAEHLDACDFCPEKLNYSNVIDRIGHGKKWQVISIKNIFPALTMDNKKAFGSQEVIIETPEHNMPFALLSSDQIESVLKLHIKRMKKIEQDGKIRYILGFKNHGARAGASREHSHSQIFASALLPPQIEKEMSAAKIYREKNKSCPYCLIAKKETKGPRKIFADKNVVAFAPYASQYHYEAWIMTKDHLADITQLDQVRIKSLVQILKKILLKINNLKLPYNFFFYKIVGYDNGHFVLKVQPRGSVWAGIELASGIVLNSVSPEEAAKLYRS